MIFELMFDSWVKLMLTWYYMPHYIIGATTKD